MFEFQFIHVCILIKHEFKRTSSIQKHIYIAYDMQSASLAIQKSNHRLTSKESAIFEHNLKLMSKTSRLKIEAQRAAAYNDWSRYDSLAEKIELQEQHLGVLAKSLRDDNCESDIDNSTISSISPASNVENDEDNN